MIIEDLGRLTQALNGIVLFAILLATARRPRSTWPIFGKPPWWQGDLAELLAMLTAAIAGIAGWALGQNDATGDVVLLQAILLTYGVVVAIAI